MKRLVLVVLILGALFLTACGKEKPAPTPTTFESPLGIPNPASVFCTEKGYQLEIRTADGSQTGYCLFPDGSECEEWAFYRGECGPGTPKP